MRSSSVAPLVLVIALAAIGCGDASEAPDPPCSGARCDDHDAGTDAGPEPEPPPSCRGVAIPQGDVPIGADGRSIEVACEGVRVRASVVDDGVVRLRYEGATPIPERPSHAIVDPLPAKPWLLIGSTADAVLVCTSEMLVEVSRRDCLLRATHADGTVLLEDAEGGGYFEGAGERGVVRRATADERFYGFGEKTGPLDKRGASMTFWNTDAFVAEYGGYPPDQDPLYQSIPFFIGLRGAAAYGVFLDNTHRLQFDMAKSDPSAYRLAAEGGAIDQYLIAGPAMADVVQRYTRLTGRMPLPPKWTLGFHQSRWGYAPDTKVVDVAKGFRDRNIPADGIWLDIQHMNGFRSFTWDAASFANPAKLVSDLAAMGFKTVAIVDPAIKVDPDWDVYSTGLSSDHFLKLDGEAYVGEVWPGPSVFPDFSSPDVRAWWASLVPRTLDAGVRGLWIDMNEPSNFVPGTNGTVPNACAAAGDGVATTMAELHNVYALDEAKATYEGMRAASPSRRPFVLTRAGYAGIQRYAGVWTGDAPSSWATLQTTLPMMLGMGLSGLPFIGSDVGGYSGSPGAELFARWMQVGAFSPFFRDHVATDAPDQEPWQFGTEVTDISREVIRARYGLLPYLYSVFEASTRTGEPILRPLVYAYQSDPATHTIGDEALLGPWLLYAPLIEAGATKRSVYLPAGRWFEHRSGAIVEGPATIEVGATLGALPIYVREGAIVPKAEPKQSIDAAQAGPLYLDVYPGAEASSFSLYEDDGDSLAYTGGAFSRVTYTTARTAGGATLTIAAREGSFTPPPRSVIMRVRRVDKGVTAVRLQGAELPEAKGYDALVAAKSGWFYDDRDLSLVVVFPDQTNVTIAMDYDPTIDDPAPPVPMTFRVKLPPGTPKGTPIHLASDASGWAHQPLAWGKAPDTAEGTIAVPRGQWVFYKYTRGDWGTVEKWPGCVEATNRYELGKAHPAKEDTVFAWADQCK